MHVDQSEALLAHFRGLLDLAGYVDLDKRKKLLRFIAYLPPSKETIEVCTVFSSCFQLTYFQMLIVNFLQTDDVLLQASAERVLNLNVNKFMDIAGGIQLHHLLAVKINSFSFFLSLFSPFPIACRFCGRSTNGLVQFTVEELSNLRNSACSKGIPFTLLKVFVSFPVASAFCCCVCCMVVCAVFRLLLCV